jgi:NAD-dependent DNA ligase
MEQYYDFLKRGSKENIDEWLGKLDQAYNSGKSGLTDENYDNMIKIYESRFGKRKVIGSKPTHSAVQLPLAMMSLDKIMSEKELESFTSKNPGPYIVMEKINGNAALYKTGVLYNRGDGTEGTDLSHMLPYLNLPNSEKFIKGELVINKKNYEPHKEEYKTNLSMINGLLNSRSADPNKLKLFSFIAYDIASSNRMSETLEKLKDFTTPFYIKTENLSIEMLSSLYKKRKEEALYDIDGLVISADRVVEYEERLVRENPKYMVAFKEYGETAIATVINVEWEVSKNKLIKPKIKISPVTINDFTIKSLTGFNAGWILENNVGVGSQLVITHNTIPHILSVLHSTSALLPANPETWKWNDTKVDIVLLEENDEVKIARIYEFFKQIGAKYLGEITIGKLYKSGFDTVKKIVNMKKEDFIKKKIEGLGEGIYDRMRLSIDESVSKATLPQLMSASCVFGIGFGEKKFILITDTYPNILEMEPNIQDIISIKGFADKTAERFIEGLPKFREFMKELDLFEKKNFKKIENEKVVLKVKSLEKKSSESKSNISGKTVVFTGFRDKALEAEIKELGGKVTTSVSKNTNCVVVGGSKGTGSSKETKATELGIPIYNLEEFKSKFGL